MLAVAKPRLAGTVVLVKSVDRGVGGVGGEDTPGLIKSVDRGVGGVGCEDTPSLGFRVVKTRQACKKISWSAS
jgi:hypothetical protein